MHEDLTIDAPLQGDTGGHIGTAPTKLHHAFPCNPPIINGHFGHAPTKITQHLEMNERTHMTGQIMSGVEAYIKTCPTNT